MNILLYILLAVICIALTIIISCISLDILDSFIIRTINHNDITNYTARRDALLKRVLVFVRLLPKQP
jgi:hypothetical protein